LTASSLEETGLEKILETILNYVRLTEENGFFQKKRAEQAVYWMRESIDDYLLSRFYGNPHIKKVLPEMEKKVKEGLTDPFRAASELLKLF
jgi:LAO/AO transport system kinase